ncbi:MAG: hypothetical protein RR324_05745 [Cellulosilyticaceae bacterium]
MNKKYFISIAMIIIMTSTLILSVKQLGGRSIPIDVKQYIGQSYEALPQKMHCEGIDIVQDEEGQVLEIFINREGYMVDAIQVGEKIEKIYDIYPEEWINTREYTIQVTYGQESHYGVATDYIIYTIGKDKHVQSILFGKTAYFTKGALPSSNKDTQKLIEGVWESNLGHIIQFSKYQMADNYLDSLWDNQQYIIFSPNSLIIFRKKQDQVDQIKLNFWIYNDTLYIFSLDQQGIPIRNSIEVFNRKDTH